MPAKIESIFNNENFYNWNDADYPSAPLKPYQGLDFELHDETPRDGAQGTYVHGFTEDKDINLYYSKVLPDLQIKSGNAGFISWKERHRRIVRNVAEVVKDNGVDIELTCAGRTHLDDIKALTQISQETGVKFEIGMFINNQLVTRNVLGINHINWLDQIKRCINLARKGDLGVMFVLEGGSTTPPEQLNEVYNLAIQEGATRLCMADTVGAMFPEGVSKIFNFFNKEITRGNNIPVDFHGHNDLGLAQINALTAARAGAGRIHSTWFGIGERNGNVPMESVLVSMALRGAKVDPKCLLAIGNYKYRVAQMFGYKIPPLAPITGQASHETGTGAHTSLMLMERQGLLTGVGDLIYKPYHADTVGGTNLFTLNQNSGRSTIALVLEQLKNTMPECNDLDPNCSDQIKDAMVVLASRVNGTLNDEEIVDLYRKMSSLEKKNPKELNKLIVNG